MNNKGIVVVTGAASGIGLSVAQKYVDEKFTVIGLDKHIDEDGQYVCTMIECDISDVNSIKNAFGKIEQRCKKMRYLINCAGIFFEKQRGFIDDLMIEEWNEVLKVNLTGMMLITQAALPFLKREKRDKAIVNLSSDQAVFPKKKNSAYIASKGGVVSFSKACATEFLEYGIRVNIIEPASVKTNFIEKLARSTKEMEQIYQKESMKMPLGIINPTDVAEMVFFLGSEKASKITGQEILIDSGLYV